MPSFVLQVAGHKPVNGVLDLGVPSRILLPDGGKYKRILHDQESDDGKDRIGVPEVWPLYISSYTDLTEAWQWFWFRVGLVHPYTGFAHWDETKLTREEQDMLKREWRSLTHGAKAFTNNAGTELYRDYISRRNLTASLPKQGDITTCGNIVRVIGDTTRWGVPVETLDGSKPPPPIELVNRLTRPDLIFAATNVAADKSLGAGKWRPVYFFRDGIRYERVDPFPNLQDYGKDTLVPLRSNGKKAEELRKKGVVSIAGTYSRIEHDSNGREHIINYAVNYIDAHRVVEIHDNYVPVPYVLP